MALGDRVQWCWGWEEARRPGKGGAHGQAGLAGSQAPRGSLGSGPSAPAPAPTTPGTSAPLFQGGPPSLPLCLALQAGEGQDWVGLTGREEDMVPWRWEHGPALLSARGPPADPFPQMLLGVHLPTMPSLSLLPPVTLPPPCDGPAQRTTSDSIGEAHLGEGKVTPSEVGTGLYRFCQFSLRTSSQSQPVLPISLLSPASAPNPSAIPGAAPQRPSEKLHVTSRHIPSSPLPTPAFIQWQHQVSRGLPSPYF